MNSFGRIFRISIFGESHGSATGIVMDGVPAGIELKADDFRKDIDRRKPGQHGTTTRIEADIPEIISGLYEGKTNGAPLTVLFKNANTISTDYDALKDLPRPGHADFTANKKYMGFNDPRGGGHFSGRLTLPLVAAGVVAKKMNPSVHIQAKVLEVGGNNDIDGEIAKSVASGDSIGGIVECIATGIPIGLGEPFFDSVESQISHLAFSIPAIKGISFGSGFESARMRGSQHNDVIMDAESGETLSNYAGGINGGITNGNPLVFRLAVKPTSSISVLQQTVNVKTGAQASIEVRGRHDACIALRVPVIAEAITAIVLADFMLVKRTNAK